MVDLQSPVGGVLSDHAVSHSIDALTTTWKRPRVRMYNGIDKICTMGLMNALTRPKITATTKMMATRCSVVSPPRKPHARDEKSHHP